MKKSKFILTIIFGILIFLICDKIRISNNTTIFSKIKAENSDIKIENLINYINNLELTDEKITEIEEYSKIILEDIKGKTSFNDYKLKEILRTYKNFSAIANNLNLKIDFSIKSGDFTLKEKKNGNEIFIGNVGEIKQYFKFIKENTAISSLEVFSDVDSKDSINTILNEINKINDTATSNKENYINKDNLNENEVSEEKLPEDKVNNINNNLKSNKSFLMPTIILIISFFIIITGYIKVK